MHVVLFQFLGFHWQPQKQYTKRYTLLVCLLSNVSHLVCTKLNRLHCQHVRYLRRSHFKFTLPHQTHRLTHTDTLLCMCCVYFSCRRALPGRRWPLFSSNGGLALLWGHDNKINKNINMRVSVYVHICVYLFVSVSAKGAHTQHDKVYLLINTNMLVQ